MHKASEQIALLLRSAVATRRAGHTEDALQGLNQAAALCTTGHDYEDALVLRELGELARDNHNLSAAQTHYEQAVRLLRPSKDRLNLAHTIRHLGDVHAQQQHWPEAEHCFVEALEIYRSHPSPVGLDLANAIRSYALLRGEIGQQEQSRILWAEPALLYEAQGIAAGVQECHRRASQCR